MQYTSRDALASLLAMLDDKEVCNITTFQHYTHCLQLVFER